MTATLRLRILAWTGVRDENSSGFEDLTARTRDVMNCSGEEWKENVEDRLDNNEGEPWGKMGIFSAISKI